ncbi:MAG TPA: lysophospholipid acyltransferase family protein, partial [Candidatus Xenobia bacterium]
DGKSHPAHTKAMKRAVGVVLPMMVRVEAEGTENLDKADGAVVYAYDHPSMLEPLINYKEIDRDSRSMAKKQLFVGPMGKLATWMGAFPVDRDQPGSTPMAHSIEVLEQGKAISIAPSGGTHHDAKTIPALRLGAAAMAVKGHADSIVPMVYDYHPADAKAVHGHERLAGRLAAGALTGTLAAAAVVGAPVVAAVVGGAALGASLGGALAGHFVHGEVKMDEVKKLGARIGGGLLGAAAAAGLATLAVVALPAAPVLGVAAAAAGGWGILRLARGFRNRDVAHLVVGKPIAVQPYVDQYGPEKAVTELTRDLHEEMGHIKERMTGVPYDPNAPAIQEGHSKPQQA